MSKYVIKDIKSVIINEKEYPWTPCDIEMIQEEIRGGMGVYEPKNKHIENADKFNITNKEFDTEDILESVARITDASYGDVEDRFNKLWENLKNGKR